MSSTALDVKRDTLPATGTWTIDSSHSAIEAVARHLMVSKVRGRFTEFTGTIEIPEDITDASVEVVIEAASIDTGTDDRDQHLRSPDFLDVENHPHLTFRSDRVVHVDGNKWEVPGQLTIRGTTNPVTLDVTYHGVTQDPWGNEVAVFAATTELDREAWGMTWNQALETGGVLVGKKLKVELDIQLKQAG